MTGPRPTGFWAVQGYSAASLGSVPDGPPRDMSRAARHAAVKRMLEGEQLRRNPPAARLPDPATPPPKPPGIQRPLALGKRTPLQTIGLDPDTVKALARKYSLP